MKTLRVVLAMLLCVASAEVAQAAAICNWSGSSRSWNHGDMSTLRTALIAAGHTVRPDAAITAGELAACQLAVIGEGSAAPTAGEMAALATFVDGGGRLLLFTNSGASGVPAANAILTALGSTLNFSGGSPVLEPFPATPFTVGPVFNIVGQSLSTSPGNSVTAGAGSQSLAGSYAAYQQIGNGYVLAFGDRFDHNAFTPNETTANGRLFLNIAGPGTVPALPTPALFVLGLLLMGAAVAMMRRNRPAQA